MVLLYRAQDILSIDTFNKSCARFLLVLYLVHDLQMCYNQATLEEVQPIILAPNERK